MSEDNILYGAVRSAWRATLPGEEFEPDRTLGDAGLDSLKAMELVLRIERALDCKIPYALLTAETTPRFLAMNLSKGGFLNLSAEKPLLFLMTGISGHSMQVVQSWQAEFEDMQLTLVDAPGLNRPRALLGDLPATAEEVAAEITRRQPDGDIRLIGASFGAALGYEVARQLQAQGRRVAFLGLIDLLPARGVFFRMVHALLSPAALRRKIAGRLPRLNQVKQERITGALLIQTAIRFEAHGLASRLARKKAKREGGAAAIADRLEIYHWRAQALLHWRPAPIEVPALLIASDDGVLAGSPRFWRKRIANLKVVRVEGSHHDLTSGPANASVMEALREGLCAGYRFGGPTTIEAIDQRT